MRRFEEFRLRERDTPVLSREEQPADVRGVLVAAGDAVDTGDIVVSIADPLEPALKDAALSLELSSDLQQHELGDGTVLSSFQRDILNALQAGKDIAISGPTSSGKSFILRKYIQRELENEDSFEAIYVVPTRALIAEVSEKLSSLNDDLEGEQEIEVRIGAYFEEE